MTRGDHKEGRGDNREGEEMRMGRFGRSPCTTAPVVTRGDQKEGGGVRGEDSRVVETVDCGRGERR